QSLLITGDESGVVRWWNPTPGLASTWLAHNPPLAGEPPLHEPHAAIIGRAGDSVLAAAKDGFAILAERENGCMFRTNEQPYVNAVDWRPDETRIAVAGRQADAMLFDAHCQLVRSLKAAEDGQVNYARFHPDGRILITVGNHGRIARWDAVTGDPLAPART